MSTMNKTIAFALGSYVVALIVYFISSPFIALAVPVVGLFGAMLLRQRDRKKFAEQVRDIELQVRPQVPPIPNQNAGSVRPAGSNNQPVPQMAPQTLQPPAPAGPPMDPELASAQEYIGIIEDMVLLEGEKNNLDDEIVQKTLSLLARLNRLIPDLVALGDSGINHNIVRLVRKDLNSTINPFLRLSGEAKRQNRRLLLDGIKDVDSKLTFYTKTLEQKDLMELHTKAELIQQRYRLND
ncbi:hypothetical protein [Paenibacillus sp. sgz302251]|uniref:hypothetical protein n=1 Tax=Paenibacillus sp. sgz302251 TaxID=3414493 RepID=UPI003C7B472F